MGFAQFMVSSIKSNSRRQQRIAFDKESIYLSSNVKKKKPQFKKASQEQLLKIKQKLQKHNLVYNMKLIGYTATILTIMISGVVIYFNHLI